MITPFQKNIFISLAVTVFSFAASSHLAFAQGTDLISRWNGDVVSDTTAADVQGNNNGNISGGVTIVPGGNGNVFKFDGYSGSINMGNPENLNFGTTEPFSLEAWFNWDGQGDHVNIIRKSNYSDNPAGYWLRILSPLASGLSDNRLEFFTGDTVGTGQPSGRVTTPINPNTWYHVVATRDSSGTMKLYLDDELKDTTQAKNADTTSDSQFAIGFWPDQNSEFFSGMISEVTVYAGALNSSEVKSVDVEDPNKVKEIAEIEKKVDPFIKNGESPGQCASFDECQAYCNIEKNFSECSEFEKKANIVQAVPQEQQAAFASMQQGEGPGQCKDEVSCRKYCEDVDNIEECVNFVEKFNLESPENLKEMRKISDAKKAGITFPGNCKTKENCMKYCEGPVHSVECMEFGLKTGLVPKEDTEAVNKILPYLKSGGKMPGGCTTKESCDAYCENDANVNECADFAVAAGFATKEEAEVMKKTGGKGPGNCKSRESCDTYCKDESHVDECINFAVRVGFISEGDAAMAKKFGINSGGPGGCKSKAECQSFCALPDNQETCSSWGKEHGIDMSGGAQGGQAGPGGCKTQDECMAYCKDHQDECQGFGPRNGDGSGTGQQDEFSRCGIVTGAVAVYVCGINGKGAPIGVEVTYFNRCHAEQQGAQILHEGACGKQDCSDIADPVCGNDGTSWVNDCHSEKFGGVKHKGVCTNEDFGSNNGGALSGGSGGAGYSGPGGCNSPEACNAYCSDQAHQEECQNFVPPTGGGGSSGGGERIQLPSSSGAPANYSGPGGCNSPEACNAYCSDQTHQEECQNFVPPN